jgi:hypothetical protein
MAEKISNTPHRNSWHSLSDEEKRLVVRKFGTGPGTAARRMGVGFETYKNLMSPGGTVSKATIDRVRSLLENE